MRTCTVTQQRNNFELNYYYPNKKPRVIFNEILIPLLRQIHKKYIFNSKWSSTSLDVLKESRTKTIFNKSAKECLNRLRKRQQQLQHLYIFNETEKQSRRNKLVVLPGFGKKIQTRISLQRVVDQNHGLDWQSELLGF